MGGCAEGAILGNVTPKTTREGGERGLLREGSAMIRVSEANKEDTTMTRAELYDAGNERRQKVLDAAHERFQRNRDSFVMRNPNAVSPTERWAVERRAERRGLEAHELQMLKERQKGELAVAREKRFGMENQGLEAAKVSSEAEAEWQKYKADKGVTAAEREWAARKEIGELESDARKYEADKRLEGVNATNASQERIGAANNATTIEAERERTKQAVAKERLAQGRDQRRLDWQAAQRDLDRQLKRDQNLGAKIAAAAKDLMAKNPSMTLEEATAAARRAYIEEQAQGGGLSAFRE